MANTDIGRAERAEAPPPFTPYTPEYFQSNDANTISHDPHLNQDGEALFRFILSQTRIPPTFILRIRGTHTEQRTNALSTPNATPSTSTTTITDFSFECDLTPYIVHGPDFYTVEDGEPAFRGEMVKELMVQGKNEPVKRKATKEENEAAKNAAIARWDSGAPPWANPLDGSVRANREASTKTLRQWADEYAASPKVLKEFIYEKFVYGWSAQKLESAVKDSLTSMLATSNMPHARRIKLSAQCELFANKVIIRPDNSLSRTLSSRFWKVVLCLTLVYPVIWLFKRFRRDVGGRWEVGGAAYAMWTTVDDSTGFEMPEHAAQLVGNNKQQPPTLHPAEATLEPRSYDPSHPMHIRRLFPPPPGGSSSEPVTVIGFREDDWFREWEPVILRCAAMRVKQRPKDLPFSKVQDAPARDHA
ncbi:hypothetical protein CPC08DRAFT_702435 [Agrocybe pediades]|nr:hypothetical protein CPC08DRAFT_702435 [Agrocybe pediades]